MKSWQLTVVLLLSSYNAAGNALHDATGPCICQNPVVDAAMNIGDEVYFFQGEHYWVRTHHGKTLSGPHLTVSRWPGAPPDMDAALKMNALNNATVFFKGNLLWAYSDDNELLKSYPKRINEALPGMPSDISGTATYYWDDRMKDYLFKNFQYWYPGNADPQSTSSGWKLPPNTKVTAGFKYHEFTYLFAGDLYWKHDPDINDIAIGNPPYPRSVATYWFHCDDDKNL